MSDNNDDEHDPEREALIAQRTENNRRTKND